MAFIQLIAKTISKLWTFATAILFLAVIIVFVVFILLVLMPDAVLGAVNIIKGWLTEVGIVGSG